MMSATVIGIPGVAILASVADWTCRDETSEQHQRGKRCMGFVNTDRNLVAEEQGYRTALYTMAPSYASPKNEIIAGRKKEPDDAVSD